MELTPQTRAILTDFLEARTGQRPAQQRVWRIEAALRPVMRAHHLKDVDALAARLADGSAKRLAAETVEALVNNETYFFRDGRAIRTVAADVLEALAAKKRDTKRLRVWSAGCSTGQEPYSLAMGMADAGSFWDGWELQLIGTDISRSTIEKAREGVYSTFEIQRGLPVRMMLRWFDQHGSQWQAKQKLREMVEFRQHNILDVPPPGKFDVILCRNVLLYFPEATRRRVFETLGQKLSADGVLMLGAGETVIGGSEQFEIVPGAQNFYRLKAASPQSAVA